jgi:defect-in-organelle-trafficking protein DotC
LALSYNSAIAVDLHEGSPPPPKERSELESIKQTGVIIQEDMGVPFDIRQDAVREAALSYGIRGGLTWRTYHIRKELETRASYLDKVFDFRNLLIPGPSGLLIEPPVVSESVNSLLINFTGQEAAVADRIYNINKNARIVSTARSWRNYLERDWGELSPPPDILRPQDEEERRKWIEWIREGWEEGLSQADEMFQDDLQELTRDYQGMVRYRVLLTQGMISPPYALQVDRGITGGGNKMRVGDRAVQITGEPQLMVGSERWQPASR